MMRAALAAPPRIRHIVIVIQENRSFDNLFATFPGADGATLGRTRNGRPVRLKMRPLEGYDIGHSHKTFLTEYDAGKMEGFGSIRYMGAGGPAGDYPYQYVDPAQIRPYWALAERYVLADHTFQ
ncbi:MAG TPA: alkaline phosphatase family protein, partial [Candidatus Baltobacteraceae bacterium]|nr:alkaline phosphatase family protein [Candidatus Baltobacteraceae bacterium]